MRTQWKYLYRVLRKDEDYRKGLTAKDPDERKLVADHVQYGRRFISQYISTTTTLTTAINFASKSKNWPKAVVRIDVAELQKKEHIEIIDLTSEHILNKHISSERNISRFYARKHKEVLIKGFVPPSCVKFERHIRQSPGSLNRSEIRAIHSYRPSDTVAKQRTSNMNRTSNGIQSDTRHSPHKKHSSQTVNFQSRYFQKADYDRHNRSSHVMPYEKHSNVRLQTANRQHGGYFQQTDYNWYNERSYVRSFEKNRNVRLQTANRKNGRYFQQADYNRYNESSYVRSFEKNRNVRLQTANRKNGRYFQQADYNRYNESSYVRSFEKNPNVRLQTANRKNGRYFQKVDNNWYNESSYVRSFEKNPNVRLQTPNRRNGGRFQKTVYNRYRSSNVRSFEKNPNVRIQTSNRRNGGYFQKTDYNRYNGSSYVWSFEKNPNVRLQTPNRRNGGFFKTN